MKQLITTLLALGMACGAGAQTLSINTGSISYLVPASEAGNMLYNNGNTLSVLGSSFALSNIGSIVVSDTTVTASTVGITYADSVAHVCVPYNLMQLLTVNVNGAHVSIVQSPDVSKEVTYVLSGQSANGSFYMDGELKASLVLNGITLVNPDSAAINIDDGKRIALTLQDGTVNSLTDGSSASSKGALMVNGHLEVKGGGTLNLTGLKKHALWTDEYLELKKSTGVINILSSVADGMNINQYMLMKGGTVNITSPGDDGISVSCKGDSVYSENGTFTLEGGTLNITGITAAAAKGVNTEGSLYMKGGSATISSSAGGTYDTDKQSTKASACLASDASVVVSGGSLNLTATGAGAKGISADSAVYISGDSTTQVTINTTGLRYTYGSSSGWGQSSSSQHSSAKGIKADTYLEISGGKVKVSATGGEGSEGIESKGELRITGGEVWVKSYDDAINSSSHMYINGGTITAIATGNDGLDANGNLYFNGGYTMAFGTSSPECGNDANEEGGYHVYFNGGTLLAAGGGNSVPTTAGQAYVITSASLTANTTVQLLNSTDTLATFTIPAEYTASQGGGGWRAPGGGGPGGGGGGRPGGGGSSSLLITCSGLTAGSSYTLSNNGSTSSITAVTTGSSR